jgi:hypothetical protein
VSAEVKAAAEAAIEAIKARVPGADEGQLELTEAAASSGNLSVADSSAAGEVSLLEKEQA